MTTSDSPGTPKAWSYAGARGYPVDRATPVTPVTPITPEEQDRSRDQPSPYAPLPDPELLLIHLTRGVLEAVAGAREPEQLARWLSDAAFRNLLKRVVLANRARAVTGRAVVIPATTIVRLIVTQPNVGVIEAVVIVRTRVRARAVAVRLEGIGDRWRASSIHVM